MRIITVILIGAAASAAIELMQFAFDAGVTEIDDVILNTLGTLVGAAAVRIASMPITKNTGTARR